MSSLIADIGGNRSGMFAGLGEGALVGNFGGLELFITYTAGSGNDIALLSAVPEPNSLLLVMGLLELVAYRRGRREKFGNARQERKSKRVSWLPNALPSNEA